MGQQQLLLLVLGIVIVGLAVVVGIQAFGENQTKANADAMVNDGVRIASDAQAWALKPQAFGGPAPAETIGDATFSQLGYAEGTQPDCATYGNLNGCYTTTAAADLLTITGTNAQTGNMVVIEVRGTDPDDITTTITNAN